MIPNGIYPSNYGLYLSNSSLFSKLGNEIVNSNGKLPNQGKRGDKMIQNQPLKNIKGQLNPQINGLNPSGNL